MQLPLVWFTLRNGGLSPVLCVLNIKLLGFLYKQLYSTHHCYCCRAKSAEANTWGVIKVIAISPPLHRIHFPLETDYSHLINTESLVCARLYFRLVGETEPDTLFLPHNLSSIHLLFSCQIMPYSLWPPRTATRQAPLSSIISWSLLKFMSVESVMLV